MANRPYRVLFVLHLVVGVGALGGGLAAILDPWEPLGVSADLLQQSPFINYFLPGLFLFLILGLGNIAGALACRRGSRYQGYISLVLGGLLILWIMLQTMMLQMIIFLHVLFLGIGFAEAGLALVVLRDDSDGNRERGR